MEGGAWGDVFKGLFADKSNGEKSMSGGLGLNIRGDHKSTGQVSGFGAPLNFGSYASSPIIGSNDAVAAGSATGGIPWYGWVAIGVSAYLLARR